MILRVTSYLGDEARRPQLGLCVDDIYNNSIQQIRTLIKECRLCIFIKRCASLMSWLYG